jgi:hypothetical protein
MTHYPHHEGMLFLWLAIAIVLAAIAWLIYTKRKGKRRK